ncbi:MAG: hypothetical protein JXA54_10735, partial [Candidatus Heimdallarchaeota archaeon]|nr:hypothetical protein [Candidatus Heimdallarchaeota archaeon]
MKKNMTFGLLLAAVFVLSAVMPFAVRDVAAGDGVVNRYAVIVGISDYKAISDLSYCDEDANDWFNQLDPR